MAAIQFEQLGKRYQIHTPHDLTPSTLNEYGDLTFDVGYLPYNTLFYLTADGERLQAFKTITNAYFSVRFELSNGDYHIDDHRVVQLEPFHMRLEVELSGQRHLITDSTSFPVTLNQMFEVCEGDTIDVFVNSHKACSVPSRISTLTELTFSVFAQDGRIHISVDKDGIPQAGGAVPVE
ncbi:hypothetical protein SS50377_25072 [Spironucleus salmonicida]|uniref:Uncharacterized protein n=1 Tax=Spironucleus salmonicida TaxID=348837 RepID=V6LHB6_9EUKA|nr:hypothetical protein SS50377_25072 [Spironucleus salmonicida]|eukprot:EST43111.1 Hypothetical protein SS50377_17270 [Spironucleus salmonicida]